MSEGDFLSFISDYIPRMCHKVIPLAKVLAVSIEEVDDCEQDHQLLNALEKWVKTPEWTIEKFFEALKNKEIGLNEVATDMLKVYRQYYMQHDNLCDL